MSDRPGLTSLDLTPISASALTAPRMLRGWRWLLSSTLLNTLIALALTITTGSHGLGLLGFGINWLYSQCIGLAIWGLIDIGRLALTPDEPRQWRRLFGIVPAGVLLGYLGGTLAADTLLRKPGQGLAVLQSGQGLALLLMSLAIGAGADHLAIEPVSVLLPCGLELLAQALSKRAYHHGIEGGVGELAAGELSAPVAGLLFLVDLAAQVVLGHSSQVVPGQIPNQLAGQHGVPPAAKRADLDLRRANTSAPLSR